MNYSKKTQELSQALICTAMAVGAILVLGIGHGRAKVLGEEGAKVQQVELECVKQLKKITLKYDEVLASIYINNCYCEDDIDRLKKGVKSAFGTITEESLWVYPGQKIKKTIYCYTRQQVLDIQSMMNKSNNK